MAMSKSKASKAPKAPKAPKSKRGGVNLRANTSSPKGADEPPATLRNVLSHYNATFDLERNEKGDPVLVINDPIYGVGRYDGNIAAMVDSLIHKL